MVLSTSSPCIFIGCLSRLRWGYCRTSVKPGTGLMRWVRYLEGFHILRIPNVSKKFTTALPNPIVVLPSGSSSLFTWGRSVEGLPLEAERLPPHTCTKWQCRALRILLSGTAHLVSGGSYPQILQIWPVLSAEQNNGNFLHVSGWKLGKSSSLACRPGGQLRWWIVLLSKFQFICVSVMRNLTHSGPETSWTGGLAANNAFQGIQAAELSLHEGL